MSFTFYDLTRIDYPDGTKEEFTYDSKGNILTRKDRAGKTWTFEYNTRGQVTKVTNPTGGTAEYIYNDDVTLASSKDSDMGTTTYGYDAFKRLNQLTHPDGTFIQFFYNLNDRITSMTDENGHTYAFQYDPNGNLTQVTDVLGNATQYGYDLMDRVNQLTNRLGKQWNRTYDNMERLASVTDPNGLQSSFGYDPRGWMNRVTRGGQSWQVNYDDEGVPTSSTTPLGYATTYQNDKLGYLSALTNPLGQTITINRDSMSRITGVTDPLNRTTTYAYHSRDFLSGVTLPLIGTAAYARNDLGLLSQITDLKGSNWTFTYTDAGRLQSESDPLGNTRQYGYDSRGRLSTTTFPEGETATRTYDATGNITRLLYSGGLDLQFTFDALNRLLTANNLALARDAEGRVTNTENPETNFGATYDDGGRLKTVTYPSTGSGQAFTVTYTYDATTGLLTRVTDILTNTQIDFIYDSDRRLTGTTRSNGVNTTFTWDNASRLTRIQDGPSTGSGFIDLQYTLDAAGQVTQAKMTVPLEPGGMLQLGTESFTYDAASRVNTSGYTYDQRGRLTSAPGYTFTWDGASRLVGINPSTGSGEAVTFGYNGLRDLITRAEGEKALRYYYNKAIRLSPIVAEKDEGTGQFLRYYIWSPQGSLLYLIDAANGNKVYFYHFDRTGSTVALTDATGTVTDAYAYDPYGGILGHQGINPQHFAFVGMWGVRQEGTTLYQMGARYYDAATARFLSREPLFPRLTNPRQLNPYAYAFANPIGLQDPTGLEPEDYARAQAMAQAQAQNEVLREECRYQQEVEEWDPLDFYNLRYSLHNYDPQYFSLMTREGVRQRLKERLEAEIMRHFLGDPNRVSSGKIDGIDPLNRLHDLMEAKKQIDEEERKEQEKWNEYLKREAHKKVKGLWVFAHAAGGRAWHFFPGAAVRSGKGASLTIDWNGRALDLTGVTDYGQGMGPTSYTQTGHTSYEGE